MALAAIVGCASGGATSTGGTPVSTVTPTAKAQFAYVGGFSGEIYSFTVSSAGVWTPTSQVDVVTGDNFGAMAMDPLGKFVFYAGFLNGAVSSYSITPGTGTLTLASTAAASNANNRPENMTIDPAGRFVYVANTGLNTVSEYTVNRTTGALAPAIVTTLPNAPGILGTFTSPGGIVTDPTGNYLYVGEYGYVVCYSIDQTTGALTPLPTPTVPGTDYFTLRLDPSGKYIYATQGRSNAVDVYSISASNGTLTSLGPIPTGNGATDIGLTIDGSHAYVIDRDDSTISLFSTTGTLGGLAPLSPATMSEFGQPYIIQMDPGGQLAYVVREAGSVQSFQINANGTLTSYQSATIADSPVGLAIYPTHP
ncbi:lactonase family protein [Granulicella paludicola]|uniref:lactonase family protein n=1 Tax=Granulicella paludicola TaxID=474951 RepID=UPI0021E0CDAF|nr:lactonase family protein [Granulicella paludicola]